MSKWKHSRICWLTRSHQLWSQTISC